MNPEHCVADPHHITAAGDGPGGERGGRHHLPLTRGLRTGPHPVRNRRPRRGVRAFGRTHAQTRREERPSTDRRICRYVLVAAYAGSHVDTAEVRTSARLKLDLRPWNSPWLGQGEFQGLCTSHQESLQNAARAALYALLRRHRRHVRTRESRNSTTRTVMRHRGCRGAMRTARTPRQGAETTRAPLCGPKGRTGVQDNFDET